MAQAFKPLALIVDDSKLARFVLGQMLQPHQVEVVTAASGEEALSYIQKEGFPDVVFMDHTMPGMDGLQAVNSIRAMAGGEQLPILMYTSKDDEDYHAQADAAGADGVLSKQIKAEELIPRLQQLKLWSPERRRGVPAESEQASRRDDEMPTASAEDLAKLARDAEHEAELYSVEEAVQRAFDQQQNILHDELETLRRSLRQDMEERLTEWHDEPVAPPPSRSPRRVVVPWMVAVLATVVAVWNAQRVPDEWPQTDTVKSSGPAGTMGSGPVTPPGSEQYEQMRPERLLSTLEWSLNQAHRVPYNELLLGDTTAISLARLVEKLSLAQFSGQIILNTHVGEFCLQRDESGEWQMPAPETPFTDCEIIEYNEESAEAIANQQSIMFGNYLSAYDDEQSGRIKIIINSMGDRRPAVPYPDPTIMETAGDWNQTAAANHRVTFKLIP